MNFHSTSDQQRSQVPEKRQTDWLAVFHGTLLWVPLVLGEQVQQAFQSALYWLVTLNSDGQVHLYRVQPSKPNESNQTIAL